MFFCCGVQGVHWPVLFRYPCILCFFLIGVSVGFLSWLFLGFLLVSASFDCPFVFGIFHCVGGLGRLVHFVCAVVFLMARLCGRCLLVLQAAYASCVCPV